MFARGRPPQRLCLRGYVVRKYQKPRTEGFCSPLRFVLRRGLRPRGCRCVRRADGNLLTPGTEVQNAAESEEAQGNGLFRLPRCMPLYGKNIKYNLFM